MAQSADPSEQDIAKELDILEALADELKDYIIDNDVYRTVIVEDGSGNRTVKMSGGDLLARIDSFRAMNTTMLPKEKDRLNGLITQIETTKQGLKTRFHGILERELKSRLQALNWTREERLNQEDLDPSPAEQQNLARIAMIRNELGDAIPEEAASEMDEMEALEEQLEAALNELNLGPIQTEQ